MVPIANQVATEMTAVGLDRRADTDRHMCVRTASISRRRVLVGLLGITGGAVGLTACSTGSSREAERGRARDAERTSVVDNTQATRSASLIMGTPPATPAEP